MFGVHDQYKGKLFKNDYLKNQVNTASIEIDHSEEFSNEVPTKHS